MYTPQHHIPKGLSPAVSFIQYIMSGYQEKLQGILKGKKKKTQHNLKREQVSETYMAGM